MENPRSRGAERAARRGARRVARRGAAKTIASMNDANDEAMVAAARRAPTITWKRAISARRCRRVLCVMTVGERKKAKEKIGSLYRWASLNEEGILTL